MRLVAIEIFHFSGLKAKIPISPFLSDRNLVATHHIANGTKSDGKQVTTEFFAIFTLKNGKIIKCEEVSRMVEGDASDKNMSYRH